MHLDLTFDLDTDKDAATRDDGATITCRASIEFPPFSMLSLIKNGQTVSSTINGSLQIDTRSVDANQFGQYSCQLNASGVIFTKSYTLKEQGSYSDHWCISDGFIMLNSLNFSQFEDDT